MSYNVFGRTLNLTHQLVLKSLRNRLTSEGGTRSCI